MLAWDPVCAAGTVACSAPKAPLPINRQLLDDGHVFASTIIRFPDTLGVLLVMIEPWASRTASDHKVFGCDQLQIIFLPFRFVAMFSYAGDQIGKALTWLLLVNSSILSVSRTNDKRDTCRSSPAVGI